MYCTHFRLWRRQGVGRLSPCSICCPLFSDALPLLSAGSADYMIWPWENLCLLFTTYIYIYISSWRFCALEGKCTYPRTLALVPRPPKLQVGDSKHHKHLRMFQIMLWHPLSGFLPVHLKIYVCRRTAQLGVAPELLRLFRSPCPHEDPADALETNRKLHSFVQHQSVWSGSKRIKKYRSWISMKRVQLKDIERFWKDPYTDPLPLRIRKDL